MATLSVNEILQDTLDAFTTMVPMLGAFSTDFSTATARKDDQIIAHISSLPAVQSYDATTGYKANAAESDSLISDVPVTLNQLKHVPVKVDYLTQLASKKNLYNEAIRNQAYVLSKSIVDYALGLVVVANFTQGSIQPNANYSLDTLELVRTALNTKKAAQIGRFGIVNSAVAQYLQQDSRISSGDYYGQLNGSNGLRTFKNIAGFENVWEYPDVPTAENLSAFYGDRRAITIASRVPALADAASLGIPSIKRSEVVTDPTTGLSLLGIAWEEPGTFDVYLTIAALYGATAGAQGGAEGAKTDYAGYRTTSA